MSRIPSPELRQRLRRFFYLEALVAFTAAGALLLMAVGPRLIGYSSFVIYGGSMEPAIHKGSVAVGKPVDADSLRVGDIIVFKAAATNTLTTHRILDVDASGSGRAFTTKGDANASPDPQTLVMSGKGSKVVYSVPYAGYVFQYARKLWTNPFAFKALVVGITLFALWSVWSSGSPRPKASAPV